MNIVFASHTAIHPSMVVGSHQLARVYARQGHRVLHISLPFSVFHLARLHRPRMGSRLWQALKGPHEVADDLFQWTPLSVLPWDAWKRRLAEKDRTGPVHNPTIPSSRKIASVLDRLKIHRVDLLLLDDPRMIGIEDDIAAEKMIYRATDLYAEFRGDRQIIEAERRLVRRADHLVATSPDVGEHLDQLSNRRGVTVIPNGFDDRHFGRRVAPHPTLSHDDAVRIVYVGAIDDRFDFEAVVHLAEQNPDHRVYLYGPITQTRPQRPPNLSCLGPLPYAELPSVLQHCQIALLPFRDTPTNHGRSPMKLYEYLASGCRVVAFRTRRLQDISDRPDVYLYDRDRGDDLVHAVQSVINDMAADAERPQNHGRGNVRVDIDHFPTWSKNAEAILALVKQVG